MLPNMKAAQGQKRAGLELRAEQGDAFKCGQSGIAATCCVCVPDLVANGKPISCHFCPV